MHALKFRVVPKPFSVGAVRRLTCEPVMDGSDGKGRPLILLVIPEQEEHRYADSVCFSYEAKTTETEYSDALRTFYLL